MCCKLTLPHFLSKEHCPPPPQYCGGHGIDSILLFLDFQKAFDSVEWNFMFKVLKLFNFGESFIEWIRILYENPTFRLKNKRWVSKTCKMQRGIRQGFPISALIVTEVRY